MTPSRNALIAIIIVLAIIAAASLGGFLYRQNKAGSVEIHFDRNGVRIQEN